MATILGRDGGPGQVTEWWGWPCGNAAAKLTALPRRATAMHSVAASDASETNGRSTMPIVTWDHVHLRSPDPEATAAWLGNILRGVINPGPGRLDVKLGGANGFIAPVTAGGRAPPPPAARP